MYETSLPPRGNRGLYLQLILHRSLNDVGLGGPRPHGASLEMRVSYSSNDFCDPPRH